MPEPIGLKYVGPGFYAGVPARDLTPEEVQEFGGEQELTKDGLYVTPVTVKAKASGKPAAKEEGE